MKEGNEASPLARQEVNGVERACDGCYALGAMRASGFVWFLAAGGVVGCGRGEPPAPEGTPWIAGPEGSNVAALTATATSTSTSTSTSTATATATATATPTPTPTPTATPTPSLLGQTRDVPHASGPAFDRRVGALWDAIVHDTADTATVFFFPLGAYEQVKDVGDPAADWRHRLLTAYRREIHALHGHLGDTGDRATLVGLEVNDARARWVEPGEEWNKIGYFRVFDSKLRYRVDGESRTFDVKSLISWRGEWYVVHLSAIK